MAIGVVFNFAGATLEMYDAVVAQMNLTVAEPGGLFHWVAATEDGIIICDAWESQEAYDAFVATKLMPALAAVGVESRPDVKVYPIHNYLASAG